MNVKEFSSIKLETHETKDVRDNHTNGELTIIWRDWDKIINDPEMIYLNSVNPGEIKGPHIHKNRTSYFFCLQGKMVIVIKDKNGKYHEIEADSETSKLIIVSNGTAAAIVNPSNNITKILVMADISWKPNDNEMENTTFDDYDWKKWEISGK
ncbi:FdtA/QdtA family cupin domain-containing protein [Candidatus Nitrosopelagicus sp.]|nr:FdtA/QdtA family cupin domain-containing protein [Candidatus Nitrosopelagicus sp.]